MSDDSGSGLSRRQMIAAGTTSLIAATAGTPEQIHLTWDDDPARTVVVSWASPGPAERPRVRIGQRVILAVERTSAGMLAGTVTWTYHARVDGLRPGKTYGYAVTADNDGNAADPFSATFTTAPEGRAAFRFTSFGDLATPGPAGADSRRTPEIPASPPGVPRSRGAVPPGDNWQAAYAAGAVETFQPLFHLLNGGLPYAGPNPGPVSPAVWAQAWRDFGNNVQASAANRPWLPAPGDHGLEPGNGAQGLAAFLTRYTLPPNGMDGLEGRCYAFRVGAVLFVCLSGDDVACSGAGTSAGGTQTRWLESTLADARADASIDWIVVQFHQCACSPAPAGNGSDLGVRQEWLPLFDTYEVDLVLSGHGHRYERSFPVRGADARAGTDAAAGPAGTAGGAWRPHPVTTVDSGVFDTSQGTVHLILGGGLAGPGGYTPPAAGAAEAATWSARRAPSSGYGIAVFDVAPGSEAGGQTSITVRYYHAAGAPEGPDDDYALFETFTLIRPRSDGRRWHPKG